MRRSRRPTAGRGSGHSPTTSSSAAAATKSIGRLVYGAEPRHGRSGDRRAAHAGDGRAKSSRRKPVYHVILAFDPTDASDKSVTSLVEISIWISVSSAGEQRPTKSAKNGSSHSPEVGGGNPCVQENARGRRWAVLPCQVGMRAFQWTGSTSISGFGAPRRRLSCRSLPADYGTRIGASGRLSAMRLVDVAAAGGWKDKATLLEC